jgi:hypothetical protein
MRKACNQTGAALESVLIPMLSVKQETQKYGAFISCPAVSKNLPKTGKGDSGQLPTSKGSFV